MPVGKFAALKPSGKAAVSAEAEAAPVERASAHKVERAFAASARCKTAPGDGPAALIPDVSEAAFRSGADTAAMPVEGSRVAASDNAVEETAASMTGEVAAALADSALLCHVEHVRDPFLHDSPVLLIVTYAENDTRALYLDSGGLQCLANLPRNPRLQHSMPPRAYGRHCILASSHTAFSKPVPSAFAAAHTYPRICQVPCALPERPSQLACQPLGCSSSLV